MKKYLFDSDILIDFFKKEKRAVGLITLLAKETLAVSVLSVTELCCGWTPAQANFFLPKFYDLFVVEGITPQIAELAGRLRWQYKKKGLNLSTTDVLIAATAIAGNYILLTRNKKDFPIPQIKFYQN